MIKVILWDVDGTLLNFLKAEKNGIRSCFKKFDLGECTDEMIKVYSEINVRYWKMLERGEMTKAEILIGRFKEFFGTYGLDSAIAEAFNKEYQVRLGDTVCFHPHAMETLKALKGKLMQCAVTNGTKIAQTTKLQKSGLDRIFDYVFISEDIGAEKPNPAFFDAVFAAIGNYAPSEVMIVGDSMTSDIQGGVNSGIVTCWYHAQGVENKSELQPDYEITDISQVLEIVL